jgi:hypothetical protein
MKVLLGSMFLMFLSYGCGEDTLDTTAKTEKEYHTIKRHDGENWIETSLDLQVYQTWKFISHSATPDGRVKIKGGYSFDIYNPTDNILNFGIWKFSFEDIHGIPICEYELPSIVKLTLAAKGNLDNFTGTFEMILDDMNTTTQITRMVSWMNVLQEIE